MLKILVVDDDPTLRLALRNILTARGHEVTEAEDGLQAVEIAATSGPFNAALLDVNMPRLSGLEALTKIKERHPETFCLLLTAYSNVKDAVAAIKNGAFDYIEKPVDTDRVLRLIDSAIEAQNMVQLAAFSAPRLDFDEGRSIIGASTPIRKVFDLVHKLAKVDTTVLIRGESGTGKELVARALHFNSHRKKAPFVAVNCGAIPENLIESELFGHEKGSFTGADRKKLGKFQFATGGTIFLDEIGDLSQQTQVKLLRVLQERRFTPVGGLQEQTADVRIIAATHKNLEKMMERESFRPDLFYRLNILPIQLPSLRERRDDIEVLVKYLISKFNKVHDRHIKGISREALSTLKKYSWPGNIRELENVIEHSFICEASDRLTESSLPAHIYNVAPQPQDLSTALAPEAIKESATEALAEDAYAELKYPALKERFEKDFIIRALKAFNGRINQTAEHTQMTKVTLLRKLEKYGINPREYYS